MLDEMKQDLEELDFDALEEKYRRLATEEAGARVARQIADTNLSVYQTELADALQQAVEAAEDSGAEAVYFEYDMDNDWAGCFFVCPDYQPESASDDEWACEYDDEVEGPQLTAFARIYAKHGGFGDDGARSAVTSYLVARTIAALGRCVARQRPGVAVCAGFHDQDPIWRLKEANDEDDG